MTSTSKIKSSEFHKNSNANKILKYKIKKNISRPFNKIINPFKILLYRTKRFIKHRLIYPIVKSPFYIKNTLAINKYVLFFKRKSWICGSLKKLEPSQNQSKWSLVFSSSKNKIISFNIDQALNFEECIALLFAHIKVDEKWLSIKINNKKIHQFITVDYEKKTLLSNKIKAPLKTNSHFKINNKTVTFLTPTVKNELLISIVLTIDQDKNNLKNAIDSILDQTYKNIELIVVGNNSSESVSKVLDDYSKKDTRVSFINLKEKNGTYFNRNIGLSIAKGTYICFQDFQCISSLNRLSQCLNLIKNYDYILGQHINITKNNFLFVEDENIQNQKNFDTAFFRKKILDLAGYFDTVEKHSDEEFFARLSKLNLKTKIYSNIFYYTIPEYIPLKNKPSQEKLALKNYKTSFLNFHKSSKDLNLKKNNAHRKFLAPYSYLSPIHQFPLNRLYPGNINHNIDLLKDKSVDFITQINPKLNLGDLTVVDFIKNYSSNDRAHVITSTNRQNFIENIIKNFQHQKYKNKHLTLVDNCEKSSIDFFKRALEKNNITNYSILRVPGSNNLGKCLNDGIERFSQPDDIIFKFDDDDFYSPEYINEQIPFISNLDTLVGKYINHYFIKDSKKMYLRSIHKPQFDYMFHVSGFTLGFSYKNWQNVGKFTENLKKGTDSDFVKKFIKNWKLPFSTSAFNCCVFRHNISLHTWKISESELFNKSNSQVIATELEEEGIAAYIDTDFLSI